MTELKILKYYLLYLTGTREETDKYQSIQTVLYSKFEENTSYLEVTCVNASVTTPYFVQYIGI